MLEPNFFQKLVGVLPRIRTKVQLTGLVVTVALALILQVYVPGNIPAILCGGMIGVSIIVFGQLFHFLGQFPQKHRAVVVLVMFAMFCAVILALIFAVFKFIEPPVTADVTLFQDALPDALKPIGFDARDAEMIAHSRKRGEVVEYSYSRANASIHVVPHLNYLQSLRTGGPIVPIWMQGFFFPVPVFSLKVNNPTDHPVFLSELILEVKKRNPIIEAFPILGEVDYDSEQHGDGRMRVANDGWGRMSNVILRYEILPAPSGLPEHQTYAPFSEPSIRVPRDEVLEHIPGVNWNKALSFTSSVIENPVFKGSQVFDVMLPRKSLDPKPNSKVGVLYGFLDYDEEDGRRRSVKSLSVVHYYTRGGPGRISPHYLYSIEMYPLGSKTHIVQPITESVSSGAQEHFLVAIFTRRPAIVDFDINLRMTSGEILKAGSVTMETFYPKWYGGNDEAKPIGSKVVSMGEVRLKATARD